MVGIMYRHTSYDTISVYNWLWRSHFSVPERANRCDRYTANSIINTIMTTKRSEFFAGIKNVIPILMGAAPFGLIYGVSARSAGIPVLAGQSMSFIVFAGSAQFITTQLIGASVPAGIIILTAFIVNLRHALYSASLAPYLKRLNTRWRLILA